MTRVPDDAAEPRPARASVSANKTDSQKSDRLAPHFVFDGRLKQNLFQAGFVGGCMISGAVLLCIFGDELFKDDLAGRKVVEPAPIYVLASVGGFVGMLIGALVSGAVIGFIAPRKDRVDVRGLRERYERVRFRQFVALGCLAILLLASPPVFKSWGQAHEGIQDMVRAGWIIAIVGLAVYVRIIAAEASLWKCPMCGKHVRECSHGMSATGDGPSIDGG